MTYQLADRLSSLGIDYPVCLAGRGGLDRGCDNMIQHANQGFQLRFSGGGWEEWRMIRTRQSNSFIVRIKVFKEE